MSIAGYYISQINSSHSNNIKELESDLIKYNMIIDNCLDKLDNSFVDTAKHEFYIVTLII